MNTTSKSDKQIVKGFNDLENQLTEEERLDNDTSLLMFRFLSIVEERCKSLGWTRAKLAQEIGTSPSYITQLFRGDKLVNMLTLAKMQKALGIGFEISAKMADGAFPDDSSLKNKKKKASGQTGTGDTRQKTKAMHPSSVKHGQSVPNGI